MVKNTKSTTKKQKQAKLISDDINELIGYAPVKRSTKINQATIAKVKPSFISKVKRPSIS